MWPHGDICSHHNITFQFFMRSFPFTLSSNKHSCGGLPGAQNGLCMVSMEDVQHDQCSVCRMRELISMTLKVPITSIFLLIPVLLRYN